MLAHSNRAPRTRWRAVEARRGAESVWVESVRELGRWTGRCMRLWRIPYPEAGWPCSPALERGELLAAMAWYRRRDRLARRPARTPRGTWRAYSRSRDLGDRQSRYETACPTAARNPPALGRLRPARWMPQSTSFPSGHAASGVLRHRRRHLPELAVPIRLLAGGVAYSRVHTGVHYPADVVIRSIVGPEPQRQSLQHATASTDCRTRNANMHKPAAPMPLAYFNRRIGGLPAGAVAWLMEPRRR